MKDPIYLALRRYRVAPLAITTFFAFLTWDMWAWFKSNHILMDEAATAGFISMMLPIAGSVKWSLENIAKGHEADNE